MSAAPPSRTLSIHCFVGDLYAGRLALLLENAGIRVVSDQQVTGVDPAGLDPGSAMVCHSSPVIAVGDVGVPGAGRPGARPDDGYLCGVARRRSAIPLEYDGTGSTIRRDTVGEDGVPASA